MGTPPPDSRPCHLLSVAVVAVGTLPSQRPPTAAQGIVCDFLLTVRLRHLTRLCVPAPRAGLGGSWRAAGCGEWPARRSGLRTRLVRRELVPAGFQPHGEALPGVGVERKAVWPPADAPGGRVPSPHVGN